MYLFGRPSIAVDGKTIRVDVWEPHDLFALRRNTRFPVDAPGRKARRIACERLCSEYLESVEGNRVSSGSQQL